MTQRPITPRPITPHQITPHPTTPRPPTGLARFAAPAAPAQRAAIADAATPTRAPAPADRGEMCDTEIDERHGHIADLDNRSILCACRACYLLFTRETAGGLRYRAVPDRYLTDPESPVTAAEWERLQIPVAVAFFLRTTAGDTRQESAAAFYPGPAGATECLLDLDEWERLSADHPLLAAARPDVEAIVIRRDSAHEDCYLVPIDACYELIGRMRAQWRGFDGGAEAHASIDAFFDDLRRRSQALGRAPEPEAADG